MISSPSKSTAYLSEKQIETLNAFFQQESNTGQDAKPRYLYFAFSENEMYQSRSANEFIRLLDADAPQNLTWNSAIIPFQTHMTTPYVAIYQGLAFVNSN